MAFNPGLSALQPYPFQRLATALEGLEPEDELLDLAVGEPKFAPPALVLDTLVSNRAEFSRYPNTRGLNDLRAAIADWLDQRYLLQGAIDSNRHLLPVAGTREALFALAQALSSGNASSRVLMPNPGYQIYEGATLLAGAQPTYLNCSDATGWRPRLADVPAAVLDSAEIVYLCSPGNPTGAALTQAELVEAIELADRHDFVLISDECYAEIYLDPASPPAGLLGACASMGRTDFRRCIACHSLSKRSNLPGLRSGFIAGDATLIETVFRYRTYHGCTLPIPTQIASATAWRDERHVEDNRARYRENFAAAIEVLTPGLDVSAPAGAFYLWPEVPGDDVEFAQRLFQAGVRVLPGSFMGRAVEGINPGRGHVRLALVASADDCRRAATRIVDCLNSVPAE